MKIRISKEEANKLADFIMSDTPKDKKIEIEVEKEDDYK